MIRDVLVLAAGLVLGLVLLGWRRGRRPDVAGLIGINFAQPHWHNVLKLAHVARKSRNQENLCDPSFVSVRWWPRLRPS